MPVEALVQNFLAGTRVKNPVMVIVIIAVHVVIFEQRMAAGEPGYIPEEIGSDSPQRTRIANLKRLISAQYDVVQTMHPASQQNFLPLLLETKGVPHIVVYEGVLVESPFVDGSVVVPGIPVVEVSFCSRR